MGPDALACWPLELRPGGPKALEPVPTGPPPGPLADEEALEPAEELAVEPGPKAPRPPVAEPPPMPHCKSAHQPASPVTSV